MNNRPVSFLVLSKKSLFKKMVLSKENFSYLDLPDLLLNIWDYRCVDPSDKIVKQYLDWCIHFAEKKWKPK